ncbi:histidine kinase [Kineosporia sp. NBRC 101677]|uniref:sensor histidine kinase n=1 Tax=Kineosporia sp. NBRC 101677 TaxID=3032197 RepID=UPI00255334A2|nr:histidine kinase [Kineosporia sp. NBRC 101677]
MSSTSLVVTSPPSSGPASDTRQWSRTIAVTLGLSAVGAVVMGPLWREYPVVAVGSLLFGAMLTCAGVILWEEPGHRVTGGLLIGAAQLWALGWSEEWAFGPMPLISGISSFVALSLAVWAMFRYPDPALLDRAERAFVTVLGVVLVGGILAQDVTMRPEWKHYDPDSWWITVYADRSLNEAVVQVVSAGQLILAGLFTVLWMVRIRRMRGLDRQVLTPMAIAAPATTLAAVTVPIVQLLGVHGDAKDYTFALQAALFALVPMAFLASVVRRRLADHAVLTLVRQVQQHPTPEAVQTSLRTALLDESLRVRYWAPELNTYVDVTGSPDDPEHPGPDEKRLLLPVTSASGTPLAVIDTDPALRRHPNVVTNALAASGLALENAQLQAVVLARLSQVRAIRMQAVQAAAAERRRVERNLHDGAQQRLLALKLFLAASDSEQLSDEARKRLRAISKEISRALDELRDLARGIHPAVLSQAGLGAAVEALAQRQPVPVDVRLPLGRYPAATEETAYSLISAVLEVAGEEPAGRVRVEIRGHEADGILTIEIEDDANRPAQLRLGAELPGMLDRVRALGGDVMFSALARGGSLMVAAIPCV